MDSHRTTDTAQRDPLHQQAFNQRSGVIGDERLRKAVDKLAPTGLASMVLFAVVNVTVFLVLGGLTPWADVSDDHGLLLTSAGWVSVLVNNSTEASGQHYMDITTLNNTLSRRIHERSSNACWWSGSRCAASVAL